MTKKIIMARGIQNAVDKVNTLFSRGNVSVFPALSSEEILDLHHAHKADLIITEGRLRAMGGVSLCTEIRKDPSLKNVSIIIACDEDDPQADEYRRAGSNAVLTNPLDPIELFSTVSRMLMVQQRMAVRIPLRLTVHQKNSSATFVGISRDISASGILLESGRILQKGERLDAAFSIGSRSVTLQCEVVRARPRPGGGFLCGVKFMNIDAKTFVLLEHFIKSNATSDVG